MNDGVAVIICTHLSARANLLRAALDSLAHQTRLPDEVVVVVDGNDELADLVRAFPVAARVVALPTRSGLAAARNAGVAACECEVVLFLDDDAVASDDWVERLSTAIDRPDVLGASGMSVPLWQAERPPWLADEFLWTLGCSYAGQPTERAQVRNVYGGCCGLRRKLFTELGGYDPRLGRSAASAGGGEEAELCLRARARWPQATFAYEPAAQIHHTVPGERLTSRYLLRRAYDEGRMKATVASLQPGALRPERAFAAHLPRAFVRQLALGLSGDRHGFARAGGITLMAGAVLAGLAAGQVRRVTTSVQPTGAL